MASYTPKNPLVLTLTLDRSTHSFLTSLRSKYFPPHRNHLSAHVTLFHAIPAHRIGELDSALKDVCKNTTGWDVFVGEPRKMGKAGVMVIIRERPSGRVEDIHHNLLTSLKHKISDPKDKLTDQDLRPMGRPHMTILNKAEKEEDVNKCLEEVLAAFEKLKQPGQKTGQQKGRALGFELWEYMGGPWKPLQSYWLQGEAHEEDKAAAEKKT